jgi:hypothetical protein
VGGGKGMYFVPEVGEEVLVAFENRNPEKSCTIFGIQALLYQKKVSQSTYFGSIQNPSILKSFYPKILQS